MHHYRSDLEKLIRTTLSEADIAMLAQRIGSKNRLTRIYKNPATANNHECLVIADALDDSVANLISLFELGTECLTYEEQKLHKEYQHLRLGDVYR